MYSNISFMEGLIFPIFLRSEETSDTVLEVPAFPYEGGPTGDLLCVILGLMYKSFSLGFPLFGFKIRLPCCTTPCINEKKLKDANVTEKYVY